MARNRLIAVCAAAIAVVALFIGGMTYLTSRADAQAPTAAPVPPNGAKDIIEGKQKAAGK